MTSKGSLPLHHSSPQLPNASIHAGTARRAGSQGVVTPPSAPNGLSHSDRAILDPIRPCRRFDANQSARAINPAGWKVVVGMSEAAVNETLTLGNAMFEASWRGGEERLTCMRGLPVRVRSRAPARTHQPFLPQD